MPPRLWCSSSERESKPMHPSQVFLSATRSSSGHSNHVGLQGKRGRKRSPGPRKHQAPRALVCFDKTRTQRGKTSSNCRLQGVKSVLPPTEIYLGNNVNHFSPPKKGVVQRKIGSQGCLFSSPSAKNSAKVLENGHRSHTVGVFGSPIWTQHTPISFHATYESIRKSVEKKRVFLFSFIWTTSYSYPPQENTLQMI